MSSAGSSVGNGVNVRLPKLELTKFGGQLHRWQEFWDGYSSAVHENNNLANADKFKYLRSLLEEPARSVVAGLPLTSNNYETAIKLLQDRYGDPVVIQRAHINQLAYLPSVYSERNTARLRSLHDQIETHYRGLEALDVDRNTYSTIVVPMLMEKIPDAIRFNMIRGTEKRQVNWGIDDLLKALSKELEIRESHGSLLKHVGQEKGTRPRREDTDTTTASSLFVSGGKVFRGKCVYCLKEHAPEDCCDVTDVSERKGILIRQARCFVCLNAKHRAFECRSKLSCKRCKGRHHVSICTACFPRANESQAQQSRQQEAKHAPNTSALNATAPSWVGSTGSGDSVALQTALAKVNAKKESKVRVLFDTGSHRSFISAKVVSRLGLRPVRSEKLGIKPFGSVEAEYRMRDIVEILLYSLSGDKCVQVECFVVEDIANISNCHAEIAKKKYPHLNEIWFSDVCRTEDTLCVDVLIGSDSLWEFQEGETRRGGPGEPVAVKTKLGWVLSGPLKFQGKSFDSFDNSNVNFLPQIRQDLGMAGIERNVNKLWDLETLGIRQENEIHEAVIDDIQFTGTRYSVGLPWKISHDKLPSNYGNCLMRLQGQIGKFRKDPQIYDECNKIIKEQLEMGIIEQVSGLDDAEKIHYMPSQTVVRTNAETTKVRLVFDASSKERNANTSLNDCLHRGPSLTPFLFDILLRFRENRIALVGDIEKAFLNIEIDPKDRDCLRFLWVKDITGKDPEIVVYRYRTVVFGVRSSPFLLNAVLQHHIKTYQEADPQFVSKLLQSFYVDDLVCGSMDTDQAFSLYQKSKVRMLEGGFRLRKWKSNDEKLLQRIKLDDCEEKQSKSSLEDLSYAKETLGSVSDLGGKTKVLGIAWDSQKDELEFDLSKMVSESSRDRPTKRGILSTLASLFDPLGLVSPIGVTAKVLFQELCKLKLEWDEPIPEEKCLKWKIWLDDLKLVETIVVPRCLYSKCEGDIISVQLHGFGDASMQAYCAVIYLVCETTRGTHVTLLCSKTRVAPLKSLSIPRLELMSARILAVLMDTVYNALKSQLKIDSIQYWLDSKTALYWILNRGEWKQWVQYRVSEILKVSKKDNWGHVHGVDNPADLGSRGSSGSQLHDSQVWWNGPGWLKKGKNEWPKSLIIEESEEVSQEKKKINVLTTIVEKPQGIDNVIDITKYSSLGKLLRVTSYVLRFINNMKGKKETHELNHRRLNVSEIRQAERHWIQQIQSTLRNEESFKMVASQLNIIEVDGILVCKGRFENSDIPLESKYPIYLPREHKLTELMIIDCHVRSHHCGVKGTLAELRSRFWISKGRQHVKKILKKCIVCKKLEGKPFSDPSTAPLPKFRVSEAPPFSSVGVDFAGPLYVKEANGKMVKCYICLFSCCVTRALHLELVQDLTTITFLNCLRRFCARRGTPCMINSDNAKTFKSTAALLRRLATDSVVLDFLQARRIEWKFNLELSPWQGGHFERLIGNVKRCLRKVLGNSKLSFDELSTVLTEVECTLNSRPLTYYYSDLEEEVLTPSHLLVGRRLTPLSTGFVNYSTFDDKDQQFNISKRFLYLTRILNHFWSRWRREYLVDLRETHRIKNNQVAEVNVGDVVLIHDANAKRGMWKIGIIEEVITGRDKQIRGAKVRKITKGKPEYVNRPLQKLIPLEIVRKDDMESQKGKEEEKGQIVNELRKEGLDEDHRIPGKGRPSRAAAKDARWRTQLILDSYRVKEGGVLENPAASDVLKQL